MAIPPVQIFVTIVKTGSLSAKLLLSIVDIIPGNVPDAFKHALSSLSDFH